MKQLGKYTQITELTNKDAGSCRWCFAEYMGKEYFIKEYIDPKHPETDTVSSPAKIEKKLKKCLAFEKEKTAHFTSINNKTDGNATRIEDLFRIGAKYYLAMPRIDSENVSEADVASLPEKDIRRICATIAHAIKSLHMANFVHSDLKPSNIMFKRSANGNLTAKVIDYDAGFFERKTFQSPEQIQGDQSYYAPETCHAIISGEINLSKKIDIFALGILFHQYFSGEFPIFDEEAFSSVGETVLYGEVVTLSDKIPDDVKTLISKMLSVDPHDRPTAEEIHRELFNSFNDTPFEEPTFIGDAPARTGWQSMGDL